MTEEELNELENKKKWIQIRAKKYIYLSFLRIIN